MPQTGEQQLEALQKDLACPNCEYNLRGLYGDIVNCPECGHECDIPYLLTRKWTGPWHKAPSYTKLALPVAWLAIAWLLVAAASITSLFSIGNHYYTVIFIFPFCGAVWLWLVYRAYRHIGGWPAVGETFLLHLVFVGYFFGFWGAFFYILNAFGSLFQQLYLESLYSGFWAIVLLFIMWLARRGEKFVAKQCIRRYLQQKPTS